MSSTHSVQLFDTVKGRSERIADFVRQGLDCGGSVLVVAMPAHWRLTEQCLERNGVSAAAAIADGRLTVLDAAHTLSQFMQSNSPDPARLEAIVGTLVRRLAQQPGRLHIYGEMVDVLAEAGNFRGAHRLEELWNGLAESVPFDLFCGYTSGHFGDEQSAPALKAICGAHGHVHTPADAILGSHLIARARLA